MTAINPSVRNAHRTNTREELTEALHTRRFDWLEADVRLELNRDRLEMRHDEGDEDGDNLTVKQWLDAASKSGKGLKFDVKTSKHWPELIAQIKAAKVPDARLMFSLGDWAAADLGKQLRAAFPGAMIAFNVDENAGDRHNSSGPLQSWQVDKLIARANLIGGPVSFMVDNRQLTKPALDRLQARAPVNIWGSDVKDRPARRRELVRMGVQGMIDLQPPASLGSVIGRGLSIASDAFNF